MRIAVGCIGHETNTFSSVPTTLDSFKNGTYYFGQEMISFFQHTRTIMGGLIKHSQALQIELIPLLWTFATPSGIVAESAYQTLKTEFLDLLQQAGKIDGVF